MANPLLCASNSLCGDSRLIMKAFKNITDVTSQSQRYWKLGATHDTRISVRVASNSEEKSVFCISIHDVSSLQKVWEVAQYDFIVVIFGRPGLTEGAHNFPEVRSHPLLSARVIGTDLYQLYSLSKKSPRPSTPVSLDSYLCSYLTYSDTLHLPSAQGTLWLGPPRLTSSVFAESFAGIPMFPIPRTWEKSQTWHLIGKAANPVHPRLDRPGSASLGDALTITVCGPDRVQ